MAWSSWLNPRWWRRLRETSRIGTAPARQALRLVAEADRCRNAGDWSRAAALYGDAADLMGDRWDWRIQQANMLKDCGRLSEAQAIYRRSIAARPRDADIHVQLGHALKLAGDRDGAIDCYGAALMLDPGCDAARRELVEIGHAHRHAERIDARRRGDVAEPLEEMLLRVAALERALADLRARLPEVGRLGVFPLGCYDLFREIWPGSPDPPTHAPIRVLFVLLPRADRPADAHEGFAGVRSQRSGDWRLLGLGPVSREALSPSALAETRIGFAGQAGPSDVAEAFGDWTPDWVVPLLDGAVPDPLLLGWIAAAATLRPAGGFVTDEEVRAIDGLGRLRCTGPQLRRQPDLDGVLSGELVGATPILRASAWYRHAQGGSAHATAEAILDLAWSDSLAHVPLPLIHRAHPAEPEPLHRHQSRVQALLGRHGSGSVHLRPSPLHEGVFRCDWPADGTARLSVIIPTRDNPGELGVMIESLRDLASRPDRVEILIADNGVSPVELPERPSLRRLGMPDPFNWSHLNNVAAADATGDILVFANDDMRMLTAGWDERLAGLLGRPAIGVVGARLLYPTGGLQHAGIMTGWRGGLVHDGLGSDANEPGPEARWFRPRQVMAVTGAFLATRRAVFDAVGGFDAVTLPVACNDVDFCFRVRAQGLGVLWDAELVLLHRESGTRGPEHRNPADAARGYAASEALRRRWPQVGSQDPFAHPAFADLGRPCQHIRPLSAGTVEAYVATSAACVSATTGATPS